MHLQSGYPIPKVKAVGNLDHAGVSGVPAELVKLLDVTSHKASGHSPKPRVIVHLHCDPYLCSDWHAHKCVGKWDSGDYCLSCSTWHAVMCNCAMRSDSGKSGASPLRASNRKAANCFACPSFAAHTALIMPSICNPFASTW